MTDARDMIGSCVEWDVDFTQVIAMTKGEDAGKYCRRNRIQYGVRRKTRTKQGNAEEKGVVMMLMV
jgi:hypothetical protein